MNSLRCSFESELRQSLTSGLWPQGAGTELRTHVDGCRICQQTLLLQASFAQIKRQSIAAARLQSPGLLWWKSQLRRRNHAVEQLEKPLLGAVVFSLVLLLAATLGFVWFSLQPLSLHADGFKTLPGILSAQLSLAGFPAAWLLALLGAVALLGSAVVYFSTDRN